MPNHLGDESGTWDGPVADGIPARSWGLIASVSLSVATVAAAMAVVLNFVAPDVIGVRGGSPIAVVVVLAFATGGILSGIAFFQLFRQADREISAGYTSLGWRSLRGSVPLVDPRSRRVRRQGAPHFDPAVARAAAPWAGGGSNGARTVLPTAPSFRSAIGPARWGAGAAIVLIIIAIGARVSAGSASLPSTLTIGVVVLAVLLAAVLIGALVLRSLQVDRLAKVRKVVPGIVVAGISSADTRASTFRLGIRRAEMPRLPVLVFDSSGFEIWVGTRDPRPIVRWAKSDVLSLNAVTIASGRTLTRGLEVTAIPPDQRWPLLLDFTIFDPARTFAAVGDDDLASLIASVTKEWVSGSSAPSPS